MTHRLRLKLASLMFATLWTAWMMWSSAPLEIAEFVIYPICGALAGFGWHWLYGRWYRWFFARHVFPRKRTT
jgi:hypothetical protein